ncbi:MAG: hypothetical protein ACR2FI_12815 [Burkholderiales bacterium]
MSDDALAHGWRDEHIRQSGACIPLEWPQLFAGKSEFLMRRLLTIFVGLLLTAATSAMAEPRSVLVVLSENTGAYREAADALVIALEKETSQPPTLVRIVPLSALAQEAERSSPGLIVPVGTRAAQAVAALESPVPVLNTLVPSQVYRKIVRALGVRDRRTFSAVFLDQPLARRLRLIQFLLPRQKHIGVVLSSESVDRRRRCRQPPGALEFRYTGRRSTIRTRCCRRCSACSPTARYC